MRQRRGRLDKASIASNSAQAKRRVENHLKLAEKLAHDGERKLRLEVQLCKACHYFSKIGGAAITHRECAGCGQDQTYGSTATDVLCQSCASKYELCKQCGGDIDMQSRRKSRLEINIEHPEEGRDSERDGIKI